MSLKKAASRTKSLSLSGDDFPLRPAKPRAAFVTAKRPEDTAKIMKYIDDSVIGKGVAFLGPFGRRKGNFKSLGAPKCHCSTHTSSVCDPHWATVIEKSSPGTPAGRPRMIN
ncbi:hypothetical protein pipiens_015712 [Culex pipiens pipiens]|uniref:Uncharacterized protein n=1 Tax=Culex pipiens pipiens TaxID=38569 RepID=A0ABD1CPC8_CULPP